MRRLAGLFFSVLLLAACTSGPRQGPLGGRTASPVPGAGITFTVAPVHRANYPPCCELRVTNTATRTLYGFSCHLIAHDGDGHLLYNGLVDVEPGLGAPPGKTNGGFLAIPVHHPDRIASSKGRCDAGDWGSEGPPP